MLIPAFLCRFILFILHALVSCPFSFVIKLKKSEKIPFPLFFYTTANAFLSFIGSNKT